MLLDNRAIWGRAFLVLLPIDATGCQCGSTVRFDRAVRSRGRFEVVDFDSARAALSRLDEHRDVKLLIADYAMPGMNRIELVQRLRERLPSLPVFVITPVMPIR